MLGLAGIARVGVCMIVGCGWSGGCGVGVVCGACAPSVTEAVVSIAIAIVVKFVFMLFDPPPATCKGFAVAILSYRRHAITVEVPPRSRAPVDQLRYN